MVNLKHLIPNECVCGKDFLLRRAHNRARLAQTAENDPFHVDCAHAPMPYPIQFFAQTHSFGTLPSKSATIDLVWYGIIAVPTTFDLVWYGTNTEASPLPPQSHSRGTAHYTHTHTQTSSVPKAPHPLSHCHAVKRLMSRPRTPAIINQGKGMARQSSRYKSAASMSSLKGCVGSPERTAHAHIPAR